MRIYMFERKVYNLIFSSELQKIKRDRRRARWKSNFFIKISGWEFEKTDSWFIQCREENWDVCVRLRWFRSRILCSEFISYIYVQFRDRSNFLNDRECNENTTPLVMHFIAIGNVKGFRERHGRFVDSLLAVIDWCLFCNPAGSLVSTTNCNTHHQRIRKWLEMETCWNFRLGDPKALRYGSSTYGLSWE